MAVYALLSPFSSSFPGFVLCLCLFSPSFNRTPINTPQRSCSVEKKQSGTRPFPYTWLNQKLDNDRNNSPSRSWLAALQPSPPPNQVSTPFSHLPRVPLINTLNRQLRVQKTPQLKSTKPCFAWCFSPDSYRSYTVAHKQRP